METCGFIFRSQYSTTTNGYINPPTTIVNVGETAPQFAVDWVSDKLYYSIDSSIWEANVNGTFQNELLEFEVAIDSMVIEIDPYEK